MKLIAPEIAAAGGNGTVSTQSQDTWQSIGAIAARLVEKAKQERGK